MGISYDQLFLKFLTPVGVRASFLFAIQVGVSLLVKMEAPSSLTRITQVLFLVLAITTVFGSAAGALQTGAKLWQGIIPAVFGLMAIGLFHAVTESVYPSLSLNPVLAMIVFLVAVEFAAMQVALEKRQIAGVAGGALMLTSISGLYFALKSGW